MTQPTDLKLKYRPQVLKEYYGGEYLVEALEGYIENEDRSHTILLHGPSGCGKTTLGRIIAKMLGSGLMPPNFLEFDLASEGGVDAAKKRIVATCRYKPIIKQGEKSVKIYLLDEAHLLTRQAASALLKTIEEPPPFVYFIFATTNPEKMLYTIRTRCAGFEVRPLSSEDMESLLDDVAGLEEIEISGTLKRKIVKSSDGCPRNALNFLGQVKGLAEETALGIVSGGVDDDEVRAMCRILLDSKNQNKWNDLRPVLELFTGDPEKARLAVLGYFKTTVLRGNVGSAKLKRIDSLASCFWTPLDRNGKAGFVLSMLAASMEVE